MVQGRSKAVFKTWFAEQPQVWRASIKTVVMDGFTGFKTAAEEISEAVPVMDPFHVVRLAGGRPGRVPPTHPTRNPRPTRPGRGPALPGPTYPSHRAGLLTDKQKNRLDALFADDRHVQVEATRAICGPPGTGPCFVGFLCCFGCGGGVRVGVAPEETAVLVGGRKRSGSRVLAGMKAEAVLHASRGADAGVIAETVERAERTVQERPADWRATRMRRVLTGHAGNQNAAEPARTRKQELKAILARPLSRTGARAGFWDVPALREVVKILFDAEHQSDSSYRLLLRLCGPNPEPPGPVRRAPRRAGHPRRPNRTRQPAWSDAASRVWWGQ